MAVELKNLNTLDKKQRNKPASFYMKYAGLAFQLGATIAVGAIIGVKLDQWLELEKQYMTILFVMIFAFAGLYVALKDLI